MPSGKEYLGVMWAKKVQRKEKENTEQEGEMEEVTRRRGKEMEEVTRRRGKEMEEVTRRWGKEFGIINFLLNPVHEESDVLS